MLSPGSRLMAALTRMADLMILNFLFLFTSIPVLTIGPGLCALYAVTFRLGTHTEPDIARAYFRAFRQNFKEGLVLGLLLLLAGGALVFNVYLFSGLPGGWRFLSVPFALLGVVYLLAAGFVFPLTALFQNNTAGTLKNALALSLGYLPRAAAVAAVNLFPLALLLRVPVTFARAGVFWLALYFSGAAYVCALLLRRVFAPYLPADAFAPDAPDAPGKPARPDKSDKPNDPDEPDGPDKSDRPSIPDKKKNDP